MARRGPHNAFRTEIVRSITGSIGRFLAIAGIVALGCGFYAGLNMCGPDMRSDADEFYDGTNLYDIQLVSTLGFSDEAVSDIAGVDGVEAVQPGYSTDVMASLGGEQYAVRLSSLPTDAANASTCTDGIHVQSDDDSYMNRPVLQEGRWPTAKGECVLSADKVTGGISVGDTVEVLYGSDDLDGTLDVRTYTIVGLVSSSSYVCSTSLGSTTLGSGLLGQYMYVSPDNFSADAPYTEVFVKASGAQALDATSNAYQDRVDEVKSNIEAAVPGIAQDRFDEVKGDAQSTLDDKKAEFDSEKTDAYAQLDDAKSQLDDAKATLDDSQAQIDDGWASYEDGVSQLAQKRSDTYAQLDDAQATLDEKSSQLDDAYDQLLASAGDENAYQSALASWQSGWDQVEDGLTQARTGLAKAQSTLEDLEDLKSKLDAVEAAIAQTTDPTTLAQLEGQKTQLEEGIAQIAQGVGASDYDGAVTALDTSIASTQSTISGLEDTESTLKSTKDSLDTWKSSLDQISDGRSQVEQGYSSLADERASAIAQLDEAQATLDSSHDTLVSSQEQVDEGRSEYEDNLATYEQSRSDADKRFSDAQADIDEAQTEIDQIEFPDIYTLDRTQNYGCASHQSDSERIDNIAAVFPLFFFLVAALVSLTTMTRMVEDERVQIGTYKALGYSTARISAKYLVYAAVASVAGGVVGLLVLTQVLPVVVIDAYGIIYNIPLESFPLGIDPGLAVGTIGIGVGITLLATFGAVWASLRETPAALMQPRAPKAGKRILLERIRPLWRRMSFTWKVTFRNLFRYKKRLLMTVIGIAGCTGLLLTGLGIRDAIWDIIDNQFDDIFHYETTITLDDSATSSDVAGVVDYLSSTGDVSSQARSQSVNMQVGSDTHDATAVQVSVPMDYDSFSQMVTFRTRLGHDPITLDDDSVIISEKLATTLGVGEGDTIKLYDQDKIGNATGDGHELTITGVMENYIGDLLYLGHDAYASVSETEPTYSTIYASVANDTTERESISSHLQDTAHVNTIVFIDETIDMYRTMLSSVNVIMVVLVVAAAALAFIVLYDLTNINIAERQREIATLKVLGFTPREVDSYIYRETILLTCIGAAAGLGAGVLMEGFCVVTAEVNRVMFGRIIHPASFVAAFALTLLFAAVVLLAMRRKLRDIDMVESLKSVE
ncbi:MAG: FtsX-like permease family protein [Atopobiaceae bacterium]|nr:FtsX-like permease family protein [Atopobiaceae bacterium]MCI2172745.1 FtsX-like permease family protein [Atopobiaceae bacterium]MCI2207052.1 FtsX-like permease family protein [Atopobiaceae bacterium]